MCGTPPDPRDGLRLATRSKALVRDYGGCWHAWRSEAEDDYWADVA
jgi:hypothetical protein